MPRSLRSDSGLTKLAVVLGLGGLVVVAGTGAVLLEAAGEAVPEVVPAKTTKSATPLLAGLVKIREQHDVRVGGPSVTVSDLRRWASEALTAYLAGAAPVGWSQNTPLGIRAEHGGARLFVVREGTGYGVVVSLGGFATEAEAKAAAEAAARGAP